MPKSLLVADDSLTIRKAIGMVLSTEDCRITAVDNGLEAVSKAKELKPDLILADVMMPGMSGYEVCQAIKTDAATQHIPVLLLAGSFEPLDENRARSAGADGHLVKPFESEALIQKVHSLLGTTPSQPQLVKSAAPVAAPQPVRELPRPTPAPSIPPSSGFRPAVVGPAARGVVPPTPIGSGPAFRPGAQPANVGYAMRPGTLASGAHPQPAWPGVAPTPAPRAPASRPGIPVGFSRPAASGAPATHPGQPPRTPMGGTPPWASHPPGQSGIRAGLAPAQPMPAPAFARGPAPQAAPAFGLHIPQAAPQPRAFPSPAGPQSGFAPAAQDGGEAALRSALASASREVIERIAWEVVPQLAETIVREHLDKLIKDREKGS
jgi:CheY-like chemotaxis protein